MRRRRLLFLYSFSLKRLLLSFDFLCQKAEPIKSVNRANQKAIRQRTTIPPDTDILLGLCSFSFHLQNIILEQLGQLRTALPETWHCPWVFGEFVNSSGPSFSCMFVCRLELVLYCVWNKELTLIRKGLDSAQTTQRKLTTPFNFCFIRLFRYCSWEYGRRTSIGRSSSLTHHSISSRLFWITEIKYISVPRSSISIN
jgi:hypothetical protein